MLQSPAQGDHHKKVRARRPGVRALIASDVRLLCDGLQIALTSDPEIDVVGIAGNADSLLADAGRTRPAVVVLDVSMPRALEAARVIALELPGTRTVGVAVDESVGSVVACAEAGLAGYVPHDATLDRLRRTVLSVTDGETPCSPRIAAGLFRHLAALSAEREQRPSLPRRLTPREYEVLRLIQRGLPNKEIAARLHIALPTVKNHVHRILVKLDVNRRGAAADWLRH